MTNSQFKKLSLTYFDSLYGFALSITGNSADAEDLVQETYLRACRKFEQFTYGTNCKAWMFKIMRNIAIDQFRKKDPLAANDNDTWNDDRTNLQTSADALTQSLDIKNAFDCIPHKYRIVVLLKDIEGYSYKEIGEILNFPVGTVMSRLFRGRKLLKSILTAEKQKKTEKNVLKLRL